MIKKNDVFTNDEMTCSDRCLHTPGDFAKQNLLYVQEVGTLQSLQPHKSIRENLDSFLLMLIMKGRGTLVVAGEQVEVAAGDGVWIDCMEHYEHISDAEDAWELAWVHFNGKVARNFYELFLKHNHRKNMFHFPCTDEFVETISRLRDKQVDKSLISEIASGEMLLYLLRMVLENVIKTQEPESESEKQVAGELRRFINEQYVEENVFDLLEEVFGKSISELNAFFVRAYNITLEEYTNNRRYNVAKELLRFSVKTTEDIARESGIGNLLMMQQMFHSNEGMTAEEYRQKWAGWIRN